MIHDFQFSIMFSKRDYCEIRKTCYASYINLKTKKSLKMRVLKNAVTLVAIAAAAGGTYQGYKVYNKPVESTLLMQNVEALSRGEDEESKGFTIKSGPCKYPCDYKRWVVCETGGEEKYCTNSDCC